MKNTIENLKPNKKVIILIIIILIPIVLFLICIALSAFVLISPFFFTFLILKNKETKRIELLNERIDELTEKNIQLRSKIKRLAIR